MKEDDYASLFIPSKHYIMNGDDNGYIFIPSFWSIVIVDNLLTSKDK